MYILVCEHLHVEVRGSHQCLPHFSQFCVCVRKRQREIKVEIGRQIDRLIDRLIDR